MRQQSLSGRSAEGLAAICSTYVVSACTSTRVHAGTCVSLSVKMHYLSRLSTAKIRVHSVVDMTDRVWSTGKVVLTQF